MPFYQSCDRLTELGQQILQTTWRKFPSLSPEQIALTWLVYDNPVVVNTDGALSPEAFWEHPVRGFQYRGDVRLYPASVVKLFYLVAIHEWLEGRMLQNSTELERAIQDMIVESSNDATSYIVDSLTGTTSGPELPQNPCKPGATSATLSIAIISPSVGRNSRRSMSIKNLGVMAPMVGSGSFWGQTMKIEICSPPMQSSGYFTALWAALPSPVNGAKA